MAVTAAHNFFISSVADMKETFPFLFMIVLTKVDSEEPGYDQMHLTIADHCYRNSIGKSKAWLIVMNKMTMKEEPNVAQGKNLSLSLPQHFKIFTWSHCKKECPNK